MRLAVSLLGFRPGHVGGAETYVRQLLRHLPAVAGRDELLAVMHRPAAAALDTPGLRRVVVDAGDASIVARRILEAFTPWRDRELERLFAGLGAQAVLFPQQSIFPKEVDIPAALTAVDVQHLIHPEHFLLFDRAFRSAAYPHGLRRARRVVAISEYTRRTLVESAGVPPGKVVTVSLGHSDRTGAASVRPLESMPGPYLYYPAATFPHKNHAALFRTYSVLCSRGAVTEPLVLTGARTGLWRRLQRLAEGLGIRDRVVHLGFLPFEEIPRVYAGASAVLFPTRFEGFGLPVLEAVEFGKRVVTSRLEIFDEIGVPRRFQIDFEDPDQLLAALRLPGPTVLERKPISWAANARATVEIMRQVAAEGGTVR